MDHVTPYDDSARSIASELISCIITTTNSEDTLQAVICDGTAVNTGG